MPSLSIYLLPVPHLLFCTFRIFSLSSSRHLNDHKSIIINQSFFRKTNLNIPPFCLPPGSLFLCLLSKHYLLIVIQSLTILSNFFPFRTPFPSFLESKGKVPANEPTFNRSYLSHFNLFLPSPLLHFYCCILVRGEEGMRTCLLFKFLFPF